MSLTSYQTAPPRGKVFLLISLYFKLSTFAKFELGVEIFKIFTKEYYLCTKPCLVIIAKE
jgi:hypothetical protein